jgi:hypothetical protein
MNWLDSHQVQYTIPATKAELLNEAFCNVPTKKYVVDEAANVFGVHIIR